jgi:hypothetical protein
VTSGRLGKGRDTGSVLMLVPAGFLIMLVLAAIAVDHSQVHLRQRQAQRVAVDIANDLVTLALDEATFRSSGDYHLDPRRAADLADVLARSSDLGPTLVDVRATVTSPDQVVVELEASVEHIFTKAIPGAPSGTTVRARATAVARAG